MKTILAIPGIAYCAGFCVAVLDFNLSYLSLKWKTTAF